jgi:hypothetical protein
MYRALKSNNVPTHLYIAPREPHEWAELRHVLFKMNVELDWFEKVRDEPGLCVGKSAGRRESRDRSGAMNRRRRAISPTQPRPVRTTVDGSGVEEEAAVTLTSSRKMSPGPSNPLNEIVSLPVPTTV